MASSLRFLVFLLLLFLVLVVSDSNSDDVKYSQPEKPHQLIPWAFVLINIWCLSLVFFAGISPYFLRWDEGFLVLGMKLSSAVFLAWGRTAIKHLLGDASKLFSFMLTSCGYLMIMFASCVICYIYGKHTNGGSDNPNVDLELQGNAEGGNLHGQSESQQVIDETENHSFLRLGDRLLLIFALCFYSVFEGIAIGVAGDAGDDWKAVLMTTCFHKIFGAIAMGIAVLRMIPDCSLSSSIAYALAFAIASPVGVCIGMVIDAITEGSSVGEWVYSISMDLAFGAFIYISFNHLLSKGYGPQPPPVVAEKPYHKLLAVLVGIGVIALANI